MQNLVPNVATKVFPLVPLTQYTPKSKVPLNYSAGLNKTQTMKSNFDSCDKLKRKGWNDHYECDRSAHMHAMHSQSVSRRLRHYYRHHCRWCWWHMATYTIITQTPILAHVLALSLVFPILSFIHSHQQKLNESSFRRHYGFTFCLLISMLKFNLNCAPNTHKRMDVFFNSLQLVLILLLWNECRLLFCLFHLMTKKLPSKALHLNSRIVLVSFFFLEILISQLVQLCSSARWTALHSLIYTYFYNMHKTEII